MTRMSVSTTFKHEDRASIPVFDLRDLSLETSAVELSSEDDEFAVPMEISHGWPIIKLPMLLIPKTVSTSNGDDCQLLHALQGRRIYSQLPPDLRDAVMMTLKLNKSVDEFFRKSVWRYFLRLKRYENSEKKSENK